MSLRGLLRASLVPVAPVAVLALALPLAGCGAAGGSGGSSGAGEVAAPDDQTAASSAGGTGGPGGPVGTAPADWAMASPGPRHGAVLSADVLLTSAQTMPAATVRQVSSLDGVKAALPVSVAQVSLDGRVYTVAAVDPDQYRRFTSAASADLQEQWNRVAQGQVAVAPQARRRLPVTDDGYLTLDVGGAATAVPVAAYAPQVPSVDLVVNPRVGQALGMPVDNALIVSTGATSPSALDGPLSRMLGGDVSRQDLDAVARYGLDPDGFRTAVVIGSLADAVGTYRYRMTASGQVIPDPSWVSAHITTEQVPILGSVTCNRALFPQLRAALTEVVQRGLADAIHPGEYQGCYVPKLIEGTTEISNHAYGLALDMNTPGNQRGTAGEFDRRVVQIFQYWGFTWGGVWHYTDPMHFELNRLVRPG